MTRGRSRTELTTTGVRLPSRWGVRPLGLRHMYLQGCGDAVAWIYRGVVAWLRVRRGAMTVSPSGLYGRLGKASSVQSWRPRGVSG
ncbi:unnamed protein product [Miscanthus lutarioriparius]|uniref:Uncharacterized protein n=1 Tax=Miscanthus lutarioriparius TaxID=422564 RepID=A0A811SJ86_9POAL|nr:unnamed protein product [Miscanthus lutarioriparius]